VNFKRVLIISFAAIILMAFTFNPAASISVNAKPGPKPTPTTAPTPTATSTPAVSQCATSSPSGGSYSVTLCFTAPANGSIVNGAVTSSVSVSSTGTFPGVQRLVFYINDAYFLTDFQSPYSFLLPSQKWADGSYILSVEALIRDGYTTANRASVSLTFSNGNKKTPVNHGTFTPTSGTTPAPGAPFVVVASGDGADGGVSASNVSSLISSLNPNLFLYLGDVYEQGSVAEFYNWYGNQGTNFSQFNSITDPTIGNHEYGLHSGGAGYFDYWNNIPNYYSYNAGGWHFISLNSNAAHIAVNVGSAQYTWLQQDLTANANACTIVYYHHPLFNIGPEGSTTAMSDIWALMAQYGVTIVLNGHDHDYQRWQPLDGSGNPSPTGITEFVAGMAGHGLQTIAGSDTRVVYWNDTVPTAFGALKLELNPSGAAFSFVNTSGNILDSGTIACAKKGPDTQAPSTPNSLNATAASATQMNLAWQPSSDNTGVQGYTIYRDGNSLATVPGSSLAYVDNTALPSTTYSYTVDAFDLAGNHSAQSSPANVTTPVMPPTLTFTVGADTYVNASFPDTNYGSATVFRALSSPDLHGLLRFTVQGLAGYPVMHAHLLVYANTNSSAGISALAVADNTWNETSVTYNTAPALGAVLGSSTSYASGTWVSIDVSSYITGEGTYSFGISTPGSTTLSFAAKESGANVAQLVVDLQQPETPTGLTATAASATEVDLSWQPVPDVDGYTVYRDSVPVASIPATSTAYNDVSVSPSTTYSYSVDSFDVSGNTHSAQSSPVSVTTPAMPSSLTFNVSADSYVNATSPDTNYGSATAVRADGSPIINGYLRFTVQGLAGYPVMHAYLLLYANTSSNIGFSVQAVGDNSWDENTITYNNAPPVGALINSSGAYTSGNYVVVDVTPYVTGEGTYSFAITTPGSTTLSFAAKESGANAAELVINLQ
jgi:hypothetical protein